MPKLEYFLVAESHSVDRSTDSISIFNVCNTRQFASFPATLPDLDLISCWLSSQEERDAQADTQLEIFVRVPGNKDEGPFRANFRCDVEFQHVILGFSEIAAPSPGMIEFELMIDNKHVATHSIRVTQTD